MNYETFFAAFGIDAAFIHMENDVAGDTYDRYFASNSANCSMWTPSAPGDGWLLLEIYDTEDGPVALYVREKKPESMRERWKRENGKVMRPHPRRRTSGRRSSTTCRSMNSGPMLPRSVIEFNRVRCP